MNLPAREAPAAWKVLVALSVVCVAWGTTFLAVKEGVRDVPPALFGGLRVFGAGVVLLLFMIGAGRSVRLPARELLATWLVSIPLFVGGNGLMMWAQKVLQSSGEASILAATSPLWLGILESLWPGGDRLTLRGWIGVLLGLGGVVVLRVDRLDPRLLVGEIGALLVLGSAFTWAIGSFAVRHRRARGEPLALATWQMLCGGGSLILVGLAFGEGTRLTWAQLTPTVIGSYLYLLVVGSLVGFLFYSWLLNNVSATLAGSHAYLNPVVALLVGWLIGGETVDWRMIAAMCVILIGVALVRSGETHRRSREAVESAERIGSDRDACYPEEKRTPRSEVERASSIRLKPAPGACES